MMRVGPPPPEHPRQGDPAAPIRRRPSADRVAILSSHRFTSLLLVGNRTHQIGACGDSARWVRDHQPHRAPVDAVGAQTRHAGMVGERADLLVAGLAGNAVAEDERMPRPGPPLPGLIGSAEEDDRERSRRGRQVRRAGVRADEEVGPLEQRGRLRDRQAAGPVAQPVVRLEDARERERLRFPRPRRPASHFRGIVRSGPSTSRSASAWPRCRPRGARPGAEGASENRSACSQSASSLIGLMRRATATRRRSRASPGRTRADRGRIDFDPARASARPGFREPAGDRDPILRRGRGRRPAPTRRA